MSDIRAYPWFGKFEGGLIVNEYVYDLSLDGCDDEAGDVDAHGAWYGIFRGPIEVNASRGGAKDLTVEECEFLASVAGAIITEDSQGFVDVRYYDADEAESLTKDWEAIERETQGEDDS